MSSRWSNFLRQRHLFHSIGSTTNRFDTMRYDAMHLMKTDEPEKTKQKRKKGNFEVRVPRLIVRNLDFKVTEERLKKTFEEQTLATIKTVSVVSKDGKSKGFGFVTFDKLEDAQKAIETMNGKKILRRPMAVDWSLPKKIYEKMHVKASSASSNVPSDSYGFQSGSSSKKEEEKEEIIEEEPEEEEEEEEEEEDEEEEEITEKAKPQTPSRDVREHRTLFVRNLPFDTTQEELKELVSSQGSLRVKSCLLVIDRISKHPRGTAFVQFATTEDAQECLKQKFKLRGQELQMDLALSRDELTKAKTLRDEKNNEYKKHDQRNLALAKIGVILNLSELDGNEQDLRKRQQLEDAKKNKLKNPMFFVSTTRLTVHNLPTNIDDAKLRTIILNALKHENIPLKNVTMTECRVMKPNKEAKKSLRYAFVNFTRHEDAVKTIELLNNNAKIFGSQRRPIVQFAVENRRALQLKDERRDRLRAKHDLLKDPTKKILTFDGQTKSGKAKNRKTLFDSQASNTRLSELIQHVNDDDKDKQSNGIHRNDDDEEMTSEQVQQSTSTKTLKRKRTKSRSKGEIRDRVDQMIAKTRNKRPLPEKKKTKWFE